MKKRMAGLTASTLIFSQVPVVTLAHTNPTTYVNADLEVTLHLDYPIQDTSKLNLKAVLLKDQKVVKKVSLNEVSSTLEDIGENAYYTVFKDLPLGTYQVQLEGNGYKTYQSEEIQLTQSEKHLVVHAGSDTFIGGDLNQDGNIDSQDVEKMEEVLQSGSTLNGAADLNGDQVIDIEDISQLYWAQGSKGAVEVFNTKMILSAIVDCTQIESDIKDANGGKVTVEGAIQDLFDKDASTVVELWNDQPISETSPVRIPLSLTEERKVSEISITAPLEGAPEAGYVVYTDETGEEIRQAFTSVETFAAKGRSAAHKVITIHLGKQVPLKKLTIEVTQTSGGSDLLAAVSKVEFLEDIVDQSINQEQGKIKSFKGTALNEGVSLTWNQTANVTGYKVQYGTEPGIYKETVYTKNNNLVIEGLENLTPYYFVVQAINGDWEGPLSSEITVTPEPQQKPSAPTHVHLTSYDKGIKVSYRLGTDALGANIYYKKTTEREYTKVENAYSGMVVKGLENDEEYMVYVVATNSAGESIPSTIERATPAQEKLIIPEIPTVGRMDTSHIVNIELLDPVNVAHKFYPEGFDIQNVIDGDFTTHWTASTYQRARGVRVTFDKSYEMDYVAFTPRLDSDLDRYDGGYKYWNYPHEYSIKVWETLDGQPKELVKRQRISNLSQNGLMILPFEKTKVAKMEIELYEWNGAGTMSISEMMFYEYQDMIERVNNIFANGLFTELRDDVTEAKINQLITEIENLQGAVLWVDKAILIEELNAAKEILKNGTPSNIGELVEVVQTRQTSTATSQNFAMDGLSNLQATGTMGYAGDEILVYVDAPESGTLPELVFSQFYGDGTWSKSVQLKEGRNVITVPQVVNYHTTKGGPIYLTYTGAPQDTTTVRIVHARNMPTLELVSLDNEAVVKSAIYDYITDLTAYMSQLDLKNKEKNPANVTEIGTDKVLLSLPAEEVYRGLTEGIEGDVPAQVERLYQSLIAWDETMKLQYGVLGLTKDAKDPRHCYPQTRLNVRYMPMNNGVFMYASGTHVGIQYHSGAALVKGNPNAAEGAFGWGINHEIGHIINDEQFVMAEITNNIFSLFAQTTNGGKSRLETSNVYPKIYEKVVSKNTGLASDVFVNLGMFWQLHLAYDDFYPTLHRLSRESNLTGLDAMNYFIRIASDVAQKDLTPFFERWGAHISSETYAYTSKYEPETKALYYLNDEAMRYRLAGDQGMEEDAVATITATVGRGAESGSDDQTVTLTLGTEGMDKEALLGYEIYRDNELIAFTTEDTYIDEIAANNVSYTYSVVAYDKLLNTTQKVQSNEVYIASEGIIPSSTYTVQTTTGAIQITLPDTPEVVGLKLSHVTTDSVIDYTVEVSEDGNTWHTAKQSQVPAGTSYLYFNKPGTDASDDRIWTYDAQYIRLSGEIINYVEASQIDVLAYPGDAVYFTEDAIGYLDADYDFGSGVIPKGTLVVMGAYRGHPVYSQIVLSAKYTNEKDYDVSERPGYSNEEHIEAIDGELYMFGEIPEDQEVSKIGNGIWLFVPKAQSLPSQIKANMFRTDDATSTSGGRLVSDTKWLLVPASEDMPTIKLD